MLDCEFHFELFLRFVTALAVGGHSGINKNMYLCRRCAPACSTQCTVHSALGGRDAATGSCCSARCATLLIHVKIATYFSSFFHFSQWIRHGYEIMIPFWNPRLISNLQEYQDSRNTTIFFQLLFIKTRRTSVCDSVTIYVKEKFFHLLIKTAPQSPPLGLNSQSKWPRIEVTISWKLLQIHPCTACTRRICVPRSSMVSNKGLLMQDWVFRLGVEVFFFQKILRYLSDRQYLHNILLLLNIFQYIWTVKCLQKLAVWHAHAVFLR